MGRLELIQPLLDQGKLVMAAAPSRRKETAYAHWLIQADAQPRNEVGLVAAWIHREARKAAA